MRRAEQLAEMTAAVDNRPRRRLPMERDAYTLSMRVFGGKLGAG